MRRSKRDGYSSISFFVIRHRHIGAECKIKEKYYPSAKRKK